jgi:hypothetical protein
MEKSVDKLVQIVQLPEIKEPTVSDNFLINGIEAELISRIEKI